MVDIFTPEKRSEIMSRIKGKNTTVEVAVFRYLRKRGIYFQKHYKKAPGCPDIALPRRKIAVFIDGDFWHGWKYPERKAKLSEFWRLKIERNMRRDRRNRARLRKLGWTTIRVWEHEIVRKKGRGFARIESFLLKAP